MRRSRVCRKLEVIAEEATRRHASAFRRSGAAHHAARAYVSPATLSPIPRSHFQSPPPDVHQPLGALLRKLWGVAGKGHTDGHKDIEHVFGHQRYDSDTDTYRYTPPATPTRRLACQA